MATRWCLGSAVSATHKVTLAKIKKKSASLPLHTLTMLRLHLVERLLKVDYRVKIQRKGQIMHFHDFKNVSKCQRKHCVLIRGLKIASSTFPERRSSVPGVNLLIDSSSYILLRWHGCTANALQGRASGFTLGGALLSGSADWLYCHCIVPLTGITCKWYFLHRHICSPSSRWPGSCDIWLL